MKKFIVFLLFLFSFSTTFALVQRTNTSQLEISQKRILFTDTGLPDGNIIFDTNSGGRVIVHSILTDIQNNKYIGGTGISYESNILNVGKIDGGYSLGDTSKLFTGDYNNLWSGYNNDCANQQIINVTPTTLPTYYSGNTIYSFAKDVYFLSTGIQLTGQCTYLMAEGGADIIGNTDFLEVILISGKYNVLKGLQINSASKDGITISGFSGNTIDGCDIYNSSRGIQISGSSYNLINNSKIYSNTIGIFITNGNDNIINQTISFNNAQIGIFINPGSRNTVSNSAIFNNSTHGYLVQVGVLNIVNNVLIYNNTLNGYRVVANNILNKLKVLNNNNDLYSNPTTGYDTTITSRSSYSPNLKNGFPTDYLVSDIEWNTGSVVTGYIITKDDVILPYDSQGNPLFDTDTASGVWRGAKVFNGKISRLEIGTKVYENISPVTFNLAQDKLKYIDIGGDGVIGETPVGDYWYIHNNQLGEFSIKKKNYIPLILNESGAYTVGRQKLMTSIDMLGFLGNYVQRASVSTLPGTSNTLLMTQKAVTDYVDTNSFFLQEGENIISKNFGLGLKMCGAIGSFSGVKNYCFGNFVTYSGNYNFLIGDTQTIIGNFSFVGGKNNKVYGNNSIVLGDGGTITGNNTFLFSDGLGGGFEANTNNAFLVKADGGVLINRATQTTGIALDVSGAIQSSSGLYLADKRRFILSGNDLSVQYFDGVTWEEKHSFTP